MQLLDARFDVGGAVSRRLDLQEMLVDRA